MPDQSAIETLRHEAQVIRPDENFEYLLEEIGDASIVLLGEVTHGTREFYSMRAEISKRLIIEKGFDAIAVEADWPDAARVSRYIQLSSNDKTDEALGGFQRVPQGCGATPELLAWSIGYDCITRRSRNRNRESNFSGSTCIACASPCTRWYVTSNRQIRKRQRLHFMSRQAAPTGKKHPDENEEE